MYSKNSINKAILGKDKLSPYLTPSPRMVPRGLDPVCHKMIMNVVNFVPAKSGSKTFLLVLVETIVIIEYTLREHTVTCTRSNRTGFYLMQV